ncbi:hypothetical protein G6F65_019405 [Rhizopus arrhizus]|nr:hypothetical protein G6F65_019405 [Rhizopus arrhizus]
MRGARDKLHSYLRLGFEFLVEPGFERVAAPHNRRFVLRGRRGKRSARAEQAFQRIAGFRFGFDPCRRGS